MSTFNFNDQVGLWFVLVKYAIFWKQSKINSKFVFSPFQDLFRHMAEQALVLVSRLQNCK